MPESALYLKAMGTAAIVSTVWVLAMSASRNVCGQPSLRLAGITGLGAGLAAGLGILALNLSWPPRNGLERLLTLVLPSGLAVECIVGHRRVPPRVAWCLRLGVSLLLPRILLHESVYLSGNERLWGMWQASGTLLACGVMMFGMWFSLVHLSDRAPGMSVPLSLPLATLCSGVTVMLAGYVKGGAVAFPIAAALAASILATVVVCKRSEQPLGPSMQPIIGLGILGLFGLVFIGRFFGEVTTVRALSLLLAPQMCWVTEWLPGNRQSPRVVGLLRGFLVAIPLLIVLTLAKRDFDRDLAPLLSRGGGQELPGFVLDLNQRKGM